MGYVLAMLGFIGVPICLAILIVQAIRKKKVKPIALTMAGLFACFVVGMIMIPGVTPEEREAYNAAQQVGAEQREEEKRLAAEKAAAEKKEAEQAAAQRAEEERLAAEAQAERDKEAFILECGEVNYKDLMRTPDDYKGEHIVITLKISQVMQGSNPVYHCYSDTAGYGLYYDDEYYVVDSRTDNGLKLLEDDIITVYGEFDGLKTVTRAIGWTKTELPQISLKYVELIEE